MQTALGSLTANSSSPSLASNSNIPTVNASYQREGRPTTVREREQRLEALSEFNVVKRGQPHGGCTASQALTCASMYARDKLARFTVSEMENHVIHATLCDPYAPSCSHCYAVVKYVLGVDDDSRGAEIFRYLLRRLNEANSIVVAKVLILSHRLVTMADTRFINPLLKGQEAKDSNIAAICARCHMRAKGGPNCDGGAALPLLDVYAAYIQSMSLHILNITKVIGTNIFKEKLHNNEFLSRMEMDGTIADLVRQSTEVLMIIAAMPVTRELLQLEITRLIMESLIIDALCLYGFDSKALESGFIMRKGTRDRKGLLKWLRVFQAFENAGHALNRFFDRLSALHIQLPVQIPKLYVPTEGSASQIRERLQHIITGDGDVDECLIDDALASAQSAIGLKVPASECHRRRAKSMGSTARSYTDSQGNSNDSTIVASNSSDSSPNASRAITGFHIPRDKSEYTLQREVTTLISEPNSLMDTIEGSLMVSITDTDPLAASPRNEQAARPQFTDEAQVARFVIFSEDLLGKGSYGTVFKAWDEEEGRHVACKQISSTRHRNEVSDTVDAVSASLKSEFEVLTSLKHDNIVCVFAFQSLPTVSRIFMEWVPGGSVQDIFKRTGRGLSVAIIRKYLTGALRGLAYMHERHIVHRDVKPGNMLVDSSGNIKLTDFGTSKLLQEVGADTLSDDGTGSGSQPNVSTKSIVGTIPYLAPENFQGAYGPSSDVWALGASAVHMYTGKVPWSEHRFSDALQLIFLIGTARPPNHVPSYTAGSADFPHPSGDFLSFLNDCFTFNKEERPTALQLLSHPFITTEVKTPLK